MKYWKHPTLGYTAYLLPNPKDIRSADYILERKGFTGMYDLKTITGRSSVGNRLNESIGQTNRVILNMNVDYNARNLATEIKGYFEANKDAQQVLIFKGKREINVLRKDVNKDFLSSFRKIYDKGK